ncbi:MAG: SsrA-binding protein SmpB [Candidatus Omnitrophica bacterium]|nr:SsrA-binding protein SmpB [Candidatus Omnitrophota bacterium]
MGVKTVATNRKAFRDYQILETVEAGIMLTGPEVKSLRAGRSSLKEAFARIIQGEVILFNYHISPYVFARNQLQEPTRERKLLLHRKQIEKLRLATQAKGRALVPLKVYFTRGIAKVELGLGQGKLMHDKRQDIKKRESDRDIDRALKR